MSQNFHFTVFSVFLCFPLFLFFRGAGGTTITLLNKCDYTVWPGILPNSDSSGFELLPGGSRSFQPPPGWSGRVWARTRCTFDPYSGPGSCLTGDCGSRTLECNGSGATPPATLAEFTLGSGSNGPDYYDVSLVDGYNVPMVIEARGGSGSCMTTGCAADLNQQCPNELRVGDSEASCRSACMAFGTPEYCCSGAYASPATCKPSVYSQMFKSLCPRAYSYAYDDATSTFTCVGADYRIIFCPALPSQRKSSSDPQFSSTEPQTIPGFGSQTNPQTIPGFGSSTNPQTIPRFGYGFGSGTQPITDSTSGLGSSSGSDLCSSSDSSSRHSPTFFIGGGQMLPNFSPASLIVNDSSFAWQLITLITASTTLLFLCL